MNKKEKSYWDIGLENYIKYIDEHGHPFVPVRQKGKTSTDDEHGFKAYTYGTGRDGEPFLLGRWVAYARRISNDHMKKRTPITAKRRSDLKKCGFMNKTDIRHLLIGDIKSNAPKIDEFIKQIFVIISKKLKGNHDELSLERYFLKEISDEVNHFVEDTEPVYEDKSSASELERLQKKLVEYKKTIEQIEKSHIRIKEIKSEIRQALSPPDESPSEY